MAEAPRDKRTQSPAAGRSPEDLWQSNPEVIKRFLQIRPDYEQLCGEVEYILRKKVAAQGIETASISSRAKTLKSVLEKLQRKHYERPFEQLTDLAGVRVVCLYGSDIANVAKIIQAEFKVIDDVDKLDELGVDQFGYGARHFIVQLGRSSSGARYDDLKQLACEVQVRTVVQDAWTIIQHHLIYKRESQVPTQLQRKLNSLAGLFETVDDQFERIREEREAYVAGIRGSVGEPAFLKTELNLDSLKEYLRWRFPGRAIERWDGQARLVLDPLLMNGYRRLADVERIVDATTSARAEVTRDLGDEIRKANDGTIPSNFEVGLALALVEPNGATLISWGPSIVDAIRKHKQEGSAG
jgi:ppGpp synthetase/RelA/SpoT-type nucleotidyltranferase